MKVETGMTAVQVELLAVGAPCNIELIRLRPSKLLKDETEEISQSSQES